MRLFFTLFFILIFRISYSQQLIFYKQYIKTTYIDTTDDGGYIVAGWHGGANGGEYSLSKLDGNGIELWRTDDTLFDGMYNTNFIYHVQENFDHTFLLSGQIQDSALDQYTYVVKTDSLGNKLWYKKYLINSEAFSSIEEPNNNSLIMGVNQGFYFLRINANGDSINYNNIGFTNLFPSSYRVPIYSVGDGYICSITTYQINSNHSILIFKIDTTLNLKWSILLTDSSNLFLQDSRLDSNHLLVAFQRQIGSNYPDSRIFTIDTSGFISDSLDFPGNLMAACFGGNQKIYYATYFNYWDTLCLGTSNLNGNIAWSDCFHATEDGPNYSFFHKSCNSYFTVINIPNANGGGSYLYKIADTTIATSIPDLEKQELSFVVKKMENGISISVSGNRKNNNLTYSIYDALGKVLSVNSIPQSGVVNIYPETSTFSMHLIVVEDEMKIVFRKKIIY